MGSKDDCDTLLDEYRTNPSAQTLRALGVLDADTLRRLLVRAFRDAPQWRIAQHLTLAWSNRIGPGDQPPDLTRAAYFAHVACQLSNEHPLARYARATIYWDRRLSYLVLDDVEKAGREISRIADAQQREMVVAQLASLKACALAYKGGVMDALEVCEALSTGPHGPTSEAILQCFISTRPSEPDLHHRAAMLSAPQSDIFGERPRQLLTRAVRVALLRALAARCISHA